MEEAIIVLIVAGFLMIAAEVFVPGLILGILGGFCLLASVVLCYMAFGPLAGTAAFAGLAVLTIAGFLVWLRIFPSTPIGRRMMLRQTLAPSGSQNEPSLVGAEGVALTPLRPAGTARVGSRRVDVVAESGYIESGEHIKVVAQEGPRVVVRPVPAPAASEKRD